MMDAWHAIFDEDAHSRGFICLQRGDDGGTREVFDTIPSDQVEAAGFDRRLGQLMAAAKDEAARRNANDERAALSRSLDAGTKKTTS
jgi:hypothetical protein